MFTMSGTGVFGQIGQGFYGSQLHGLVDLGGPDVKGPAEDEGKPSTLFTWLDNRYGCGHNDIVPHLRGYLIIDFGVGVGMAKTMVFWPCSLPSQL